MFRWLVIAGVIGVWKPDNPIRQLRLFIRFWISNLNPNTLLGFGSSVALLVQLDNDLSIILHEKAYLTILANNYVDMEDDNLSVDLTIFRIIKWNYLNYFCLITCMSMFKIQMIGI